RSADGRSRATVHASREPTPGSSTPSSRRRTSPPDEAGQPSVFTGGAMAVRSASVVTLTIAVMLATARAFSTPADPVPLVAHDWASLTSVPGADGAALQWSPQGGQSDLPCFVERSVFNVKGWLGGTVRMETLVLYFYAPQPVSVNVDVAFHDGLMTEWYPHATAGGDGAAATASGG